MKLHWLQLPAIAFLCVGVIQNLQLHAFVSQRLALHGSANGQAVIGAPSQLKLKSQNEIRVFPLGKQRTAAAFRAVDHW